MKKWLVIMLLLVVAAGTFVPCCGVDDCCADQLTNTTNHDRHKNEGACSPFFACATCPGSVIVTNAVQIQIPVAEKPVHHQPLLKFNLPTFSPSFWQPPRSC
jgi:hypothetical protein